MPDRFQARELAFTVDALKDEERHHAKKVRRRPSPRGSSVWNLAFPPPQASPAAQ